MSGYIGEFARGFGISSESAEKLEVLHGLGIAFFEPSMKARANSGHQLQTQSTCIFH